MSAQEFLDRVSKLKIAVIGDFIVDRYVYGDVSRISPEAPVPVLLKEHSTTCPGGAGNVARNIMNLGAHVSFFTRGDSKASRLSDDVFIHPGVTPIKTRIMCGNHHLMRIDEEPTEQTDIQYDDLTWREDFEKALPNLDAVVFSDYHKGAISHDIARIIIDACRDKNIPVIVDAKRDFDKYKQATIVKCNKKEFNNLHDRYKILPVEFCGIYENDYLVVTQGQRGISWYTIDTDAAFGVDGISVNIVDVCGAGDTVTAMIAIGKAAGMTIGPICDLANLAAAEVCTHPGVYPVMKEDLIRIWR